MRWIIEGFRCEDILDSIYYEYDKEEHLIPGKEEEYFFNDQMKVYYGMKEKFYSYSGSTSMGKSFVVQTFIQQQIENGSTDNFAILVPTKALINEVRSNMIGALQDKLKALNYRVVTASGDLVLQQNHHFIFIMTPERLLHMMIERENICVDFLFIDAQTEGTRQRINELAAYVKTQDTQITEYDDKLVRKYIDQIKIYDDKFVVCFKAKMEINVLR